MRQLILTPLPISTREGSVERACRLDWQLDGETERLETLWFRFPDTIDVRLAHDDCDAFLISMLGDAMTGGYDLIVKGRVSPGLLANLHEVQNIWTLWWPDDVRRIHIEVDGTLPQRSRKVGAIAAYSGGLDAMFTVLRHSQKLCGYRSQDVKYGLLVHGFDIPLTDRDRFSKTADQCAETLSLLNIDLVTVATNFRELSSIDWEQTHGIALAAVLSTFKHHVGTGMIGSSHVYGSLRRYGSTPLTDMLLSSDAFSIFNDGADQSRTEKADLVGRWPEGANDLRVCWEGKEYGNCGNCEKCMRTAMNFLACGHPRPASIPNDPDLKRLRKVMIYTDGYMEMWQELIDMSDKRRVRARWRAVVKFVLIKSKLRRFLKPKGYKSVGI